MHPNERGYMFRGQMIKKLTPGSGNFTFNIIGSILTNKLPQGADRWHIYVVPNVE